jgi:hypothetical protein
VLAVVDHLAAVRLEEGDAVADHGQVLLGRGGQHRRHVQQPRLAEDADHRGLGVDERLHVGIGGGLSVDLAGAAERRQLGVFQLQLAGPAEELDVLGVGARVAALDEVNAEPIQHARDLQLVLDREGEALALCSVPKRRVEQMDLHGHSSALCR